MNTTLLDKLKHTLHGDLIMRHEPGYAEACEIWNAMIAEKPRIVVLADSVADVIAVVNFAREQGVVLAIRGGGHNIAGKGTCDDGIMLNLSRLRTVEVDVDAKTATVAGGATFADLDAATQTYGLATSGGVVSNTGVAGLTLGGGFGWLARRYGLSADNLIEVDLVTADGVVVTANADHHEDLFWAVRGAGANFGVVVRFVFRLHEVGPKILFGPSVFSINDAPAMLRHWRDFCEVAPMECCVWANLTTAPAAPFIPSSFHGEKVLLLMQAYSGDIQEGQELLSRFSDLIEPVAEAVAPVDYVDAQQFLDETYAFGARNYWGGQAVASLSDEVLDTAISLVDTLPTRTSEILFCQLGGAIDELPCSATAYPHRGQSFVITPGARWLDVEDDVRCINWVKSASAKLSLGQSSGQYVNFVADREGREHFAYGSNYSRLLSLKQRWDPTNLFRTNQNIVPRNLSATQ